MFVLTVTIAATGVAQRIIPLDPVVQHPVPFQFISMQYTSANAMYVGDDTVSATKGYLLTTAIPKDFWCPQGYTEALNGWYVFGTAADVLHILVIQ